MRTVTESVEAFSVAAGVPADSEPALEDDSPVSVDEEVVVTDVVV